MYPNEGGTRIMKENRKLLREVLNDIRHDKVNAILAKQSALERQV